jgi:hypothetical protein
MAEDIVKLRGDGTVAGTSVKSLYTDDTILNALRGEPGLLNEENKGYIIFDNVELDIDRIIAGAKALKVTSGGVIGETTTETNDGNTQISGISSVVITIDGAGIKAAVTANPVILNVNTGGPV